MNPTFDAHDEHYASKTIEPILVQEQVIDSATEVPNKARLCIVQAIRYLMRVGTKQGEDWQKELDKAENYIHRARTGQWIPKESKSECDSKVCMGISKNTLNIAKSIDSRLNDGSNPTVILTTLKSMSSPEVIHDTLDLLSRNFGYIIPSQQPTKKSPMVAQKKAAVKAPAKKPTASKTVVKKAVKKVPAMSAKTK